MVDAIVSLAIERTTDLLIQEADFLSGVKADVIRLKDELKRMHCFLKDADSRQHQDERVRNWISDIRAVAYDSEDIIDTFILKITRNKGGSCQFISKWPSLFHKAFDLQQVGNQIESIRTRIADISASMQTYGIKFDADKDGHEIQNRIRRSYPHDEEEHVISFDVVTRDLKTQLMREDEQFRVVSIVGMGGLGKTTLAKIIYNDIHVRQHFDCCSWAFISQQFSPSDVLIAILTQVATARDKNKLHELEKEKLSTKLRELEKEKLSTVEMKERLEYRFLLGKMNEEELVKTLYQALGEKRYMVVLDDIWTNEAWNILKRAFPNGMKGSKVLFTTRNRDVASYADPWSTPLEPPSLSNDEGWELLRKKAFPRDVIAEKGWPPEYERMGREMVEKCEGLPLAVAVIGGLLATKKSLKEWKMVQRNINAHFAKLQQDQQYGGVYGILALSYHNLPFHLKPCFLYLVVNSVYILITGQF